MSKSPAGPAALWRSRGWGGQQGRGWVGHFRCCCCMKQKRLQVEVGPRGPRGSAPVQLGVQVGGALRTDGRKPAARGASLCCCLSKSFFFFFFFFYFFFSFSFFFFFSFYFFPSLLYSQVPNRNNEKIKWRKKWNQMQKDEDNREDEEEGWKPKTKTIDKRQSNHWTKQRTDRND